MSARVERVVNILHRVWTRLRAATTRLFSNNSDKTQDANAVNLRNMLPECPICARSVDGHTYGHILSGRFDSAAITTMLDVLKEKNLDHLFKTMLKYPWDSAKDGTDLFLIECPGSTESEVIVCLCFNPFELFLNPKLFDFITVSKSMLLNSLDKFEITIENKEL